MGARGKTETPPPKMTPIFSDGKGNMYKQNPEYTKKMEKIGKHPFGMMAYGMHRMNPSKNKFGTDNIPGDDERFIKISSGASDSSSGSKYGTARRYNPKTGGAI